LFRFVDAKVFCHFNLVAAIAGSAGSASSTAWVDNDDPLAKAMVLRCEFGVWDLKTRIDMLMLRMFAKLCTCDPETTHYRAMMASFGYLSPQQRYHPSKMHSAPSQAHHRSWAQMVLAAAARFKISLPVFPRLHGLLTPFWYSPVNHINCLWSR
jgi:hypothetical protein